MADQDSWQGRVEKKSRALLDGSNLYRRVTVRTDDGRMRKIRVARALWDDLSVGDRLAKDAGEDPRRA
jgi:hypothetical protein